MADIRVIEFVEPAKTHCLAVFAGTTPALAERFQPVINRSLAVSLQAADVVSVFLTPTAVLAFVFAAWRLGNDIGWTGEFPVTSGLFSHWLVWVALGVAVQMSGRLLRRSEVSKSNQSPQARG